MILLMYPAALLLISTGTAVQWENPPKVIGTSTPLKVLTTNPHGVREVRAAVLQEGKSYPVYSNGAAARRWSLFRTTEKPVLHEMDAGTKAAPGLKDGKAQLVVEAVSNDLRGRTDRLTLDVEVNTQPPSLQVDDTLVIVSQGGAGAIGYSASGYWTETGVKVGGYRFRSYPNPSGGGPAHRLCVFGFPHDVSAEEKPVVYALNPTGAEVVAPIKSQIQAKKFRRRKLDLTQKFLDKIFQELDRGGTGDAVTRFTRINRDLRKANNQTLADLRLQSADKPLWSGPFQQLANTSVEAQFCDYRTYIYEGKSVDEQVHLGFDLASTAHAKVVASNDGKVVHAAPLGIYGNAIVIDHGMGVQSLYAHLSQFGVKAGDSVKKDQEIARSGSTGLAGGDHLHFSMLVDGVPVNPLEWWDPLWLEKRLTSRY